MKKGIVFILAILYITITSGVVMNIHFCMGNLASIEYGYYAHKKCGKCGMSAKNKGCCHTESTLIKVDDVHQLVKANVPFTQLPAEIPPGFSSVEVAGMAGPSNHFIPFYHAPPDPRLNHVYLSNCVFRI